MTLEGSETISKKSKKKKKRKKAKIALVGLAAGLVTIWMGFLPSGPQIFQFFYDRSAHVSIKYEDHSLYGCDVEGVDERCVEISDNDPNYMPRIQFDITNNSGKPIAFHNEDAVTVTLEEYIPYEDLAISNEAGGAEGWDTPVNFVSYIGTNEGDYPALSEEHTNTTQADYYSTLSVDPDESKRILLTVYPPQAGLYKFKVKLKYYYRNKEQEPYTTDKDFYYVYKVGATG